MFTSDQGTHAEIHGQDEHSQQPYVVIRADGSFDFSHTMLGMVEGNERLRTSGDRVYFESDRPPEEASGYLEVVQARYTPTRSELVLRQYYRETDEFGTLFFKVRLFLGMLLYEAGESHKTGSARETATLLRKKSCGRSYPIASQPA